MKKTIALGALALTITQSPPNYVFAQEGEDAVEELAPATEEESVEATGEDAKPAPVMPPPMIAIAPAPPSLPVDWKAAPRAGSAGSTPFEKKAAKQYKRDKDARIARCFNQTSLKEWTARPMLEACDWLLGQPASSDDEWDLRARVLQYRALALINLGGKDRAFEALDESDAIGEAQGDPLFDLGVGIGNELLRAWLLADKGEKDEAKQLLQRIRDERPYAQSVIRAADRLEIGMDNSMDTFAARAEARQRLDPDVARGLLYLYLLQGKLDQADDIGDRVSIIDPNAKGGWTVRGGGEISELDRTLTFSCFKGYAAKALGKDDKAELLFGEARQEIAEYVGLDPRETSGKRKPKKRDVKNYDSRKTRGDGLTEIVDECQSAARLRSEIDQHTMEDMLDEVGAFKNPSRMMPAMIDLISQYSKSGDSQEAKAASIMVGRMIKTWLGDELEVEPGRLGGSLPRHENLDQIPKFASTASKWLFSDGSGYSQAKEGDGDIRTVRYETMVGAPAMVEEMLLLAVANYARDEGKDSFVLLSHRTFPRRIITYGAWSGSSTSNAGYESQARVLLVDSNNPPPEVVGQESRLISVAEVERALRGRYENYVARKEAEKAAEKAKKR